MFKEVKGRFGVPRLLSSRRVGDNYIAPRAKFWALWHKEPPKTLFEQWRLHRTIYLTEGRPLIELDSLQKLVEAILHAMLGLSCRISHATIVNGLLLGRPLGPIRGRMAASRRKQFKCHGD
jgi:hypothetical protein